MLALFAMKYSIGYSQIYDPVKWTFKVVKQNSLTYKVYYNATIERSWHIYSQFQPSDAVAEPLVVRHKKNLMIKNISKITEVGQLQKYRDRLTNIPANQYSNKLTLTQTITLVKPVPTKLTGVLTYQTCNNERCLPPEDVEYLLHLK